MTNCKNSLFLSLTRFAKVPMSTTMSSN
jgi:hypothetical protein